MTMKTAWTRLAVALVLIPAPVLVRGAMPTKADVIRVADKHFSAIDPQISVAQKNKILSWVNTFPAVSSTCPGFKYSKSLGRVITTSRAGAFFQIGFEAVIKGRLVEAEWCFLQALKIDSDCVSYLSNVGFVLNAFEDYEDALVLLNYAIAKEPGFGSAWVNIGYANKRLRRYKPAKKAYQVAIGLYPEIDDYKQELREVYESESKNSGGGPEEVGSALDMLNSLFNQSRDMVTKAEKGNKGRDTTNPKSASEKGAGQSDQAVKETASKMGSSYDADMKALSQFVPGLAQVAAQFMREAEWHGQKAQGEAGILKHEHEYAETGYLLLAFLVKGYIADMTGSWDEAGYNVASAFARSQRRPNDYNPIRGLGGPDTKFPPLTVGIDGILFKIDPNDQELEMEVGEGLILGLSMSEHGWGVKVGVGVMAEATLFGGEAAYFWKYDSIKGFLDEVKITGTFSGVKVGLPVADQQLWGFENLEGTGGH